MVLVMLHSEYMDRAYYSKLQQRFVSSGEYFDELLFATLSDENYEKPLKQTTEQKR